MLLGTRREVYLSVTAVLLVIGIYTWNYIGPSHVRFQIPQHVLGHGSSDVVHEDSALAILLRPEDHVHREAKAIHHVWNITSALRAPDGVTKQVYLINGAFPGPLIEAKSGDELVIEVQNSLDGEDAAIHWHGLEMRHANDMDGVVGLTQSPIRSGETFTYRFKISDDQAGTFWYHAHSELQRADGLYGALIVHEGANARSSKAGHVKYDEDLVLMIGDWYHRSARQVLDYYTLWTNFGIEPAPDSIVLNGKGQFNCSMAVRARPLDCKNITIPPLRMNGRRTRLRVINTGALTGFTLTMSGHAMTVIKLDGGNDVASAPATNSIGVLYPGERMDIVVESLTSDEQKDSVLTIKLDRENLKFKNFALTPTQHFPISTRGPSNRSRQNQDLVSYKLANASAPATNLLPTPTDQTILLYTKVEILAEYSNIPKGFINRTSWEDPRVDVPPMLETDRKDWDGRFVPRIQASNEGWVDIVLNNMDEKGHPFHLHGHSFYVLAVHKGQPGRYQAYNPFNQAEPAGGAMNIINPIRKDTVYVPGMGYAVLRFRPDNEGLWLFHCHVLWHRAVGMAMAFQIGGDENGIPQNPNGR